MTQASEIIPHVRSLLDTLGQSMTLTRDIRGAYDPATGARSLTSQSTQVVRAAISHYDQEDVDGDEILRTDVKLIISPLSVTGAALTLTPEIGDVVTGNDAARRIKSVHKIVVNNVNCVYICQGRI